MSPKSRPITNTCKYIVLNAKKKFIQYMIWDISPLLVNKPLHDT